MFKQGSDKMCGRSVLLQCSKKVMVKIRNIDDNSDCRIGNLKQYFRIRLMQTVFYKLE